MKNRLFFIFLSYFAFLLSNHILAQHIYGKMKYEIDEQTSYKQLVDNNFSSIKSSLGSLDQLKQFIGTIANLNHDQQNVLVSFYAPLLQKQQTNLNNEEKTAIGFLIGAKPEYISELSKSLISNSSNGFISISNIINNNPYQTTKPLDQIKIGENIIKSNDSGPIKQSPNLQTPPNKIKIVPQFK